jgi:hypothetical protein
MLTFFIKLFFPRPKTPTPGKSPRKPFRYRPGTLALKEIRRYQNGTNCLIPRLPFARVIKEIAGNYQQ